MPSLYCFVAVHPRSSELRLLRAHLHSQHGMLASCDAWRVLSNESLPELLPHKAWPAIAGSMEVHHEGGDGHAAAHMFGGSALAHNTRLFTQVWKAIIDDGGYKAYDWVVKVDADAVRRTYWHTTRLCGPIVP